MKWVDEVLVGNLGGLGCSERRGWDILAFLDLEEGFREC